MSIAYIFPQLKELNDSTVQGVSTKRKDYKRSNDKNAPIYGDRLLYFEDFSKADEEYKQKNFWTMKTINDEYEIKETPEQCDFEIIIGLAGVIPKISGDEEAFGDYFMCVRMDL